MNIFAIISSFGWFALFISIIVFVHEFGHYYMARRFGVRVEIFSIGFGRELWGKTDRFGTRWKICVLPLGGYVKMFGDSDPTSTPDFVKLADMNVKKRTQSFFYKPLWQKAMIVAAGPAANYLLALLIFTFFLYIHGLQIVRPIVSSVTEDSPAQRAGLMVGDKIVAVDDTAVDTFQDVRQIISVNVGEPILLTIDRQGQTQEIQVTPYMQESKTGFGDVVKHPVIGVGANHVERQRLNIFAAFYYGGVQCYKISQMILTTVGQMLVGTRGTEEMGGPVRIAQYSAAVAKVGVEGSLFFIAMVSLNLGLINLLPIPLLDGGHLLFYAVEALRRGKPMPQRLQNILLRVGGALLMALMIMALGNDIIRILS